MNRLDFRDGIRIRKCFFIRLRENKVWTMVQMIVLSRNQSKPFGISASKPELLWGLCVFFSHGRFGVMSYNFSFQRCFPDFWPRFFTCFYHKTLGWWPILLYSCYCFVGGRNLATVATTKKHTSPQKVRILGDPGDFKTFSGDTFWLCYCRPCLEPSFSSLAFCVTGSIPRSWAVAWKSWATFRHHPGKFATLGIDGSRPTLGVANPAMPTQGKLGKSLMCFPLLPCYLRVFCFLKLQYRSIE